MNAYRSDHSTQTDGQTNVWCAGDLRIFEGTQQVVRDGGEIPLPKLSFDLLLALVRAAPNTLSLDDLLREVWPGLVVSPETVTQRVKLLRDALGDDSQAPRYIAGVRGRGYRLLAPVGREPAIPASEAVALSPSGRTGLFALVAAVTIVTAVTLLLVFGIRDEPAIPMAPPTRGSIAVLPFATLSPDAADHDYFAAGVHDDLLTRLAQIDGLDVISRGSVLQYRDTHKSLPEIARELGVAKLLEGSVQQVGGRVRVNAQLIDAVTDTHVWAQVYDRELTVANLLDIQADIAKSIAGELQVELQPRRIESLSASTTNSMDAYRLYLEGNEYRYRWSDEAVNDLLLISEDNYRRAIAIDPSFALAHAGLGRVLADIYWQQARPSTAALLEESRAAAERALRLAPGLAEAHLALAHYHYYGFRDYAEALDEIALAEQAMPGSADVYYVKALVLRRLGRLQESFAATQRLVDLTPRGRSEAMLLTGMLVRQGRLDDASAVLLRWLELTRDDVALLAPLAEIAYLRTGQMDELRGLATSRTRELPELAWQVAWSTGDHALARDALHAMPKDDDLSGDSPPYTLYWGLTELLAGNEAAGRAELTRLRGALQAEVKRPDGHSQYNSNMRLALVLAALDEPQAAVAAAHQAVALLPLERDQFQGARLQVELAMVYAQAGDQEQAMDALERGVQAAFGPYPLSWQADPRLASLRGDPRFQALVARYGAGGARWRNPGE